MEIIPEDIEKKLQLVLRHIEESAAFDGIGDKDFNDATSVSSLALASGLSVRSLRDYFKAYTGQSLVNYVSGRHAEYAASNSVFVHTEPTENDCLFLRYREYLLTLQKREKLWQQRSIP